MVLFNNILYLPCRLIYVRPAKARSAVSSEECAYVQLQRVCGHEAGGRTFQLQAAGGNHRQTLWPMLYSGSYSAECDFSAHS